MLIFRQHFHSCQFSIPQIGRIFGRVKPKQFQEYFITMRDRRPGQKKGSSKSNQKRSVSKKHELNLFVRPDFNQAHKNRGFLQKNLHSERRQSRSQQSSRKSQKQQFDLLLPTSHLCLENWIDTQQKANRQKPSKNQFNIQHVIGKGGFGKVWKVEDKKSGQVYAMKEMSKAVIMTKKSMDSVANQRELLTKIKHKFIVNMRQAFQDREYLYLLMDLMPGGDLRYHICKKHQFTELETRFFTACIFTGLEYLHSHQIIHRDLKPENLVLDNQGYIHLTDLGIAKHLRADNNSDTSGTPGYMAPEVMCRQNHSFQVDFYALGVILYELMMGKRPYLGRSRKQIREQILAHQTVIRKSDIPDGWSVEAADFINKLIQRKPMMRLGWGGSQEVKSHPWLRNFPWQLLEQDSITSPFKPFSKYNAAQVRYQVTKDDDQMNNLIKENKMLLRKSSVQKLFQGYTYNQELKEMEHHTTSSELHRRKDEGESTQQRKQDKQ